jgi:hypothetical protein
MGLKSDGVGGQSEEEVVEELSQDAASHDIVENLGLEDGAHGVG